MFKTLQKPLTMDTRVVHYKVRKHIIGIKSLDQDYNILMQEDSEVVLFLEHKGNWEVHYTSNSKGKECIRRFTVSTGNLTLNSAQEAKLMAVMRQISGDTYYLYELIGPK